MPPAPLNDRLLRSWLRCRRRAWLDRHGPQRQRLWSAHRALALHDQVLSFESLVPRRPGRGEAACAEGADGVVGLRLRGTGPAGLAVEAHPSLLERIEGTSRWGAHRYRPVLARQGRRTTREHRLLLALWGRLLAQRQAAPVPHGLVLAGRGRSLERQRLSLTGSLQGQLDSSLQRLAEDLRRPEPPPLVNDRRKCTLCSWRGICDAEAEAAGHLGEVSGIGGKRRELLLDLGITDLHGLAAADPEQLAAELGAHGEQHAEAAPRLVAQARVQAEGRPRRLRDGPALPELVAAPGVLVYDIESDPDSRDDFLHGVLHLPRRPDGSWPPAKDGQGRYRPLLALREHGEARLWARLRRLLEARPDWPLLHYGETEALALLRLAERQGAPEAERQRLRRRMVDVHERLRRHWLLPVNGYGLKAVATWLGFRWSQKGVDGARCLLWWRQWRRRHDRQALARIFRYNHDDALATWAVARWLLDQEAAPPPAPTGGSTKASGSDRSSSTPG
jgi:uncharacterized protein